MGQLKPLVISESDVARDSWDDTTKGVLGFRTLFSAGTTATQALTAGVADLNAGDWLGLHRHTPAEIYYIGFLPVVTRWSEVGIIAAASLAISLLATLYPAIQVSRRSPLEGLRYE